MMQKKLWCSLLIVFLFFFIHACKKDEKKAPAIYDPTPYPLYVPSFIRDHSNITPLFDTIYPLSVEGVALGKRLFYEKLLSRDRTLSCGSCHQQRHAFSDPERFSTGINGQIGTRHAMTLMNLAWDKQFFWDGRASSLEDQVHDPVTAANEMGNTWPEAVKRLQAHPEYPDLFFQAFGTRSIDSSLVAHAIAQFERTLLSFNSRFDQFYYLKDNSQLTASEQRGFELFTTKALCNHCHMTNTLFSTQKFQGNGLDEVSADPGMKNATGKAGDHGKFKVPTLRNIAVSAPYMHDGRFKTLEEVVEFYNSQVHDASLAISVHIPFEFRTGLGLSAQEKEDLVAFLQSLTDSSFLNNPAFAE